MNKKKLILSIGLIISIFSLVFTFIYYKSNNRLVIYTTENSYAYTYAKKNMIHTYNVSDSHYKYFHRVWEDFKYNEEKDGLIITKYEGVSEQLIIPTEYNNKKIIKIEKDAIPSNVKSIFLPKTVKSIEEKDFSNIEILCYRGNFCESLKVNNDLNVKILDDVDRYIFYEEPLEFTYNVIKNNEIELTNYLGNDENIIIPETINGYKVTSMTFDGEGITSIFIPETVKNISGNITSELFNKSLFISTIIIIFSLITYCISILLTKTFEIIDKVYIYTCSIIYLIVINYLVLVMRTNPFENIKYLIYSILLTIIYLILNYLLSITIKNNKKFDNEIKQKNTFIKEMQLLLKDYEFDEIEDINAIIKYSDPVSTDEVSEIEEEIKKEIKNITKENVNEKCKILKKLLKKRNAILKDNK